MSSAIVKQGGLTGRAPTLRDTAPMSTDAMPRLGMVYDRAFPAGEVVEYARRVEAAGLGELWFIEDCFFTTGISLSAAALASTERVQVGLGVMPAVARPAAFTAMEISTLCNLAPGRFTPGIGHGVQSWMGQMGVRATSPLTALDETITQVRRLLAGEEVTFAGRTVTLDRVQLDQPPATPPPLLAGVQQEKSLALAGRVADGVVLAEGAGPTYIDWAIGHTGRAADDVQVVTFTMLSVERDRRAAYEPLVDFVAGMVREERPALRVLPFWSELRRRVTDDGPAALLDMPADHWLELGAIGTPDDAVAHLASLAAAGVDTAAVFPGPALAIAYEQIDALVALRDA
ncbi:MAG: LLM class flavin-dependent oxidoreductase [Actinomycetota bacterium]